jgi:hypothetical protein
MEIAQSGWNAFGNHVCLGLIVFLESSIEMITDGLLEFSVRNGVTCTVYQTYHRS